MEENKQVVAEWKALNQPRLQEIKKANPELYSAVNLALQYLNQKLGGEELPDEVELPEEIKVVTISNPLTLDELNQTTIYLPTTEMREEFQKILFDLGGKWDIDYITKSQPNETKIIPDTLPFYSIDNKGRLEFDGSMDIFETYGYKDITKEWPEMKKRYVPSSASTKQWTLDDFKNVKIIVDTPEKSRKFQELFLGLGGEWSVLDNSKQNTVANLDKTRLVTSGSKLLFYDSVRSFNSDDAKLIFYDDIFPGESESTESQTTTSAASESEYTWPIETYPAKLSLPSWVFNFEGNNGNRKSPTQSAGELKRRANLLSKPTDAMMMILSTKFKGNDGNWYVINIGKGGVWTWKETTPPPTQSTSFTSTASSQPVETSIKNYKPEDLIGREIYHKGNYKIVKILKVNPKTVRYQISNSIKDIELDIAKTAIGDLLEGKVVGKAFLKDWKPEASNQPNSNDELLKMSDAELLRLYSEIGDALNELDPSDPEYTELRLKQIEVSDELDKRN